METNNKDWKSLIEKSIYQDNVILAQVSSKIRIKGYEVKESAQEKSTLEITTEEVPHHRLKYALIYYLLGDESFGSRSGYPNRPFREDQINRFPSFIIEQFVKDFIRTQFSIYSPNALEYIVDYSESRGSLDINVVVQVMTVCAKYKEVAESIGRIFEDLRTIFEQLTERSRSKPESGNVRLEVNENPRIEEKILLANPPNTVPNEPLAVPGDSGSQPTKPLLPAWISSLFSFASFLAVTWFLVLHETDKKEETMSPQMEQVIQKKIEDAIFKERMNLLYQKSIIGTEISTRQASPATVAIPSTSKQTEIVPRK
ncbi:hypothetical protein GCM10028805_47290 [Spirosoma harenae]